MSPSMLLEDNIFVMCLLFVQGPALLASIAMENAPLFFSMNALPVPVKLEEEYQNFREVGASRKTA